VHATHEAHGFNPVCNDEFHLRLEVADGVIRDVGFEGAGCAISTASCSLMTEAVKGKRVDEAQKLFRSVHELLTRDAAATDVGKLAILAGVRDHPLRVKCATSPACAERRACRPGRHDLDRGRGSAATGGVHTGRHESDRP